LKLLLLAICVLTLGFLLAVNILRVEIDDALGSRHAITSDPKHVYPAPSSHNRSCVRHE
jgi:hypothetical protein